MRNSSRMKSGSASLLSSLAGSIFSLLLLVCGAGCAADQAAQQSLDAGFTSIANAPQNDELTDALTRADAQLAKEPAGKNTARALYLRGRALEQRVKKSPAQATADFGAARQAYVDALQQSPGTPLEYYIRSSLANICYWQDDYTTAQQQWAACAGKFDDDTVNSFVQYRIGLCQQRLGNFIAADQTFATVQEKFQVVEVAQRAKAHTGFRFFTVQLATFANAQTADAAVAQLLRENVNPKRITDPRGTHVVTIGPCPNYAQAQQLKARFIARYPDAVIVP
ncbi:MAG: SPOR domain-containing protein [Anaerolineae bacterium]|nr:SPOR domain-containing protein [Phycisphaerae bacterium]